MGRATHHLRQRDVLQDVEWRLSDNRVRPHVWPQTLGLNLRLRLPRVAKGGNAAGGTKRIVCSKGVVTA